MSLFACRCLATTVFLTASLGLAACNGGDGGGDTQTVSPAPPTPPVTTTQDPSGLYNGTLTSAQQGNGTAAAVVDASGVMQVATAYNTQISGKLTTTLGSIGGPLRFYNSQGVLLTTGTFAGNVLTRSKITGTFTAANGDHGSLTLAYDSQYIQPPPSLQALAGYYYWTSDRNDQMASLSVKADGTLFGIDEFGCSYTGALSFPDTRFDLLNLTLAAGASPDCGAASSAPASGFAVYTPNGDQGRQALDFLASNDGKALLAGYEQSDSVLIDDKGIYTGTMTLPQNVTHPIVVSVADGIAEIVDQTTNYLYSANLYAPPPDFHHYSSGFTAYDDKGQTHTFYSTAESASTFEGDNIVRRQIGGTLTQYTGEQDTFVATFDKPLYEQPMSLATIVGTYAETSPRNGAQARLSVSPDGALSGTTEFGCVFSGKVKLGGDRFSAVGDNRYNMFVVTIPNDDLNNCLNGSQGTAYYLPASDGTPAGLAVAFSNYYDGTAPQPGGHGYWAVYQRQ